MWRYVLCKMGSGYAKIPRLLGQIHGPEYSVAVCALQKWVAGTRKYPVCWGKYMVLKTWHSDRSRSASFHWFYITGQMYYAVSPLLNFIIYLKTSLSPRISLIVKWFRTVMLRRGWRCHCVSSKLLCLDPIRPMSRHLQSFSICKLNFHSGHDVHAFYAACSHSQPHSFRM